MDGVGVPILGWYYVRCPGVSLEAARSLAQQVYDEVSDLALKIDYRQDRWSEGQLYESTFFVALGEES